MQSFTEIQALMESELNLMNKILVDRLDSNVDLINQMSHYIINSGGKRIRPLLLLICAGIPSFRDAQLLELESKELHSWQQLTYCLLFWPHSGLVLYINQLAAVVCKPHGSLV